MRSKVWCNEESWKNLEKIWELNKAIIKNPLVYAIVVSTSASHYIFLNMQVVQLNNALSHATKIN